MIRNLRYVTSFNRKGTWKVAFLEIVHSIFVAAPSGILLVIVWELFSPTPDTRKIATVLGLMTVMLIVQFFIAARSMVSSNIWVYDLPTQLRIRLGNRIQKFSLGFFKQRDPGEIASVILQDVANFEGIFGHSLGNLASAAFGTVVLSVFLLSYDWRLALCLLAALPLIYPFLWIANTFVHKLATIKNAGWILVLQNGRIAESGSHDQLMEQAGIYRNMWNIQAETGGWKVR